MKKLAASLWLVLWMCGCGGGGGTQPPSSSNITVSLSPKAQIAIDQGQTASYTATLQNDSSSQGVTWSVTGAGCTGSACGTFTATTSTTATYKAPALIANISTVTIKATSAADSTKSASAVVQLNPPPQISTITLPNATPANYYPAQNYSQTLQASGGVGSLTWTIVSGSLPGGMQLSPGGLIYGTPTSSSTSDVTSNFTVQATDSSQAADGTLSTQRALSITVVGVLTVTTTTSALPIGTLGTAYSVPIESVGGTLPVTWQLVKTGGSLPAGLSLQGSSNTSSTLISGTPTQIGNFSVQIQAVDSSTPRQTSQLQTLTVVINSAPLVVTSTALPNATEGLPYNAQLVASGGSAPYSWSQSGAPTSWLTFPASGTLSGTPVAANVGVTEFPVTVTDALGATATATVSLTVENAAATCADTGNESAINGQYAFNLSGYTDRGFLSLVGAFTADGSGNITAGEVDTNGILGAQTGSLYSTTSASGQPSSFYKVGANNLGCATFATPFGTFVTRFSLAPPTAGTAATRGRIISWDAPTSSAYLGTGRIARQSISDFVTGVNGRYVFRESGWDMEEGGGRMACAGYFLASKFIVSGSQQDCNDAGTASTPVTGATVPPGTYTAFDLNGRATATMTTVSSSGTITYHFTLYMISASDLLLVNSDAYPALSGEMVVQTVPTGSTGFSHASLSGNTVFYLNGGDSSGAGVSLNLANFDGASSSTVTSYLDYQGVWAGGTPPLSLTCPYAVEASGRVTINCSSSETGGEYAALHLYLTDLNTGFVLDTLSGVDAGALLPQSGNGSFSNGSLSGTFTTGVAEVVSQGIGTLSAGLSTLSSGAATGTRDETSISAQTADRAFTDAYTINADGTFTATSSASPLVGVVVNTHTVWMLDPASISTAYPTLLLVQQ